MVLYIQPVILHAGNVAGSIKTDMKIINRFFAVLISMGLGTGVFSDVPAVDMATDPGQIVFSSLRPGNWDIFYFAQPGTSPKRLTDHPGLDYEAVFSPDGRWVVFTSERRGHPDLYIINLENNTEPRLLIDNNAMEDQAVISPDGRTIAFVSTESGNADIYSMPFEPEKTRSMDKAVNLTRHPGGDFRPAFSPDGRRIAFSTDRDTEVYGHPGLSFMRQREGEIYVMDADGSNLIQLTNDVAKDNFPVFAPSGDAVVFSSDRDSKPDPLGYKSFDNYIIKLNPDGTPGELVRITDDPGHDAHPNFSPDGKWIVYTSERAGLSDEEPLVQEVVFGPQMYGEIFAYRLSDGLRLRLTHNKWEESGPFWMQIARQPATTGVD